MKKLKVEIINLKTERPLQEYDIRIHRGTPLGNPFKVTDESLRDEMCDAYITWFYNHRVLNNSVVAKELARIQAILHKHKIVRLFCWCVPKRCHGETIKEFLLNE